MVAEINHWEASSPGPSLFVRGGGPRGGGGKGQGRGEESIIQENWSLSFLGDEVVRDRCQKEGLRRG